MTRLIIPQCDEGKFDFFSVGPSSDNCFCIKKKSEDVYPSVRYQKYETETTRFYAACGPIFVDNLEVEYLAHGGMNAVFADKQRKKIVRVNYWLAVDNQSCKNEIERCIRLWNEAYKNDPLLMAAIYLHGETLVIFAPYFEPDVFNDNGTLRKITPTETQISHYLVSYTQYTNRFIPDPAPSNLMVSGNQLRLVDGDQASDLWRSQQSVKNWAWTIVTYILGYDPALLRDHPMVTFVKQALIVLHVLNVPIKEIAEAELIDSKNQLTPTTLFLAFIFSVREKIPVGMEQAAVDWASLALMTPTQAAKETETKKISDFCTRMRLNQHFQENEQLISDKLYGMELGGFARQIFRWSGQGENYYLKKIIQMAAALRMPGDYFDRLASDETKASNRKLCDFGSYFIVLEWVIRIAGYLFFAGKKKKLYSPEVCFQENGREYNTFLKNIFFFLNSETEEARRAKTCTVVDALIILAIYSEEIRGAIEIRLRSSMDIAGDVKTICEQGADFYAPDLFPVPAGADGSGSSDSTQELSPSFANCRGPKRSGSFFDLDGALEGMQPIPLDIQHASSLQSVNTF